MNTAKLQKCHIFKHITRGKGSKSIRNRSNCWEYRFCEQFIFHIFAVNVRKLFVYIYRFPEDSCYHLCFFFFLGTRRPLILARIYFSLFWHTFTRQILLYKSCSQNSFSYILYNSKKWMRFFVLLLMYGMQKDSS